MKLRKNLTQVSTFFLYRLARILIRKGEEVLSPAHPLRGLARVLSALLILGHRSPPATHR